MAEPKILEQKCPNCDAAMVYNPTLNKLECEYCGTTIAIPEEDLVQSTSSRKEKDQALEEIKPLPVYNCLSCGAEVLVSQETGALTCPFCQNNIVLTQQFSGTIKPDGIIPFKITPETLSKEVQNFYKDKPLLSKTFFSESKMGKVTGIYVPFWVFDCEVNGALSYNGTKPGASYRRGDYIISETQHYILERNISVNFANLALDASEKLNDDLMDSVCPYRFEELKPFDIRYLAGYVADRFDKTSQELQKRNDQRVLKSASQAAIGKTTFGYGNVSLRENQLKAHMEKAKYVLLPMYLFHVDFHGKSYEFAVNGQTGKVVGNLPRDTSVETMYFLKRFILAFLFMAILIFVFFVW
ncbi:MAG: hypothetical protein Q4C49_04760 [Bacillota bacterium]|nr:hypothetical protein [Bacillota bacterium]